MKHDGGVVTCLVFHQMQNNIYPSIIVGGVDRVLNKVFMESVITRIQEYFRDSFSLFIKAQDSDFIPWFQPDKPTTLLS